MASNSFGDVFRFTTFGESHGRGIGVTIDGCPAGVPISLEDINQALAKRAPGANPHVSPRKESDLAEILSGIFEGKSTGHPITVFIPNRDQDSSKYEPIKHLLRPGHANFTYLEKYGVFDYRGGGRASARETAARVVAGVIAENFLGMHEIAVHAYLNAVGDNECQLQTDDMTNIAKVSAESPIFCPDVTIEEKMTRSIQQAKASGDSLGGVVGFITSRLPVGLGDPVYDKLEAKLAYAMLSIPATKGFEIGEGFHAASMQGSEHNDSYQDYGTSATNHAGGTLGGISTGAPLFGKVAFKPTSSIAKPQESTDLDGKQQIFELPKGSRHDPCVAIRAVPVVKAMVAVVLADALLKNRLVRV